jgi:DNA-directed RNA polymerase subunit H (RpoH/RPB5)
MESDAVVEKIEAKPGNVLEIKRKSKVAGECVYYRIVEKG